MEFFQWIFLKAKSHYSRDGGWAIGVNHYIQTTAVDSSLNVSSVRVETLMTALTMSALNVSLVYGVEDVSMVRIYSVLGICQIKIAL